MDKGELEIAIMRLIKKEALGLKVPLKHFAKDYLLELEAIDPGCSGCSRFENACTRTSLIVG